MCKNGPRWAGGNSLQAIYRTCIIHTYIYIYTAVGVHISTYTRKHVHVCVFCILVDGLASIHWTINTARGIDLENLGKLAKRKQL